MNEFLIKLTEELSKDPEIKEISIFWYDHTDPWHATKPDNIKPNIVIKKFKKKK